MSISKCIVRLKDCHNTEHSVEVYAQSLYEAVLRGLNCLQDVGWESNRNETIQRVEVEIHQEPTRHTVDVPKLLKWIEEKSTMPMGSASVKQLPPGLSIPFTISLATKSPSYLPPALGTGAKSMLMAAISPLTPTAQPT
jgi:hypothetical protein